MSLAEDALSGLLALDGRTMPGFVEIEADAPALDTLFAADEAAAAAQAATGVLAADIWNDRGGAPQTVRVATREAGAGLISFALQRFEDPDRAPAMERIGGGGLPWTSPLGFFPTRDGRNVFLHPSFPDSARRLLALLGAPDERDAVAAAAARWDAKGLEDAIAEAGACGAMVRTPQEWDDSDQGRALADLPLVEVVKVADSPPEPFRNHGDMPLSGVRVLDLTRVLAGPTCARTLAQYGAEVLAIAGPDLPLTPMFVADTSHGKRSAYLDLKSEAGRERLKTLVRGADVFSQGYRSGALERLGFGETDLAAMRPGIVSVSINCYGHEGPWRCRPGWEQLAQTVTGLAHLHGGAAGPALQPGAVCDYTTGFLAAYGAMIALRRRAVEGGSWRVRVSLAQTGVWVRSLGLRDTPVRALSSDEIAGFCERSDSGFGPVSHLRPAVRMSATQPRWTEPTRPLGVDPPVWKV
jgi:crotonobetainyl-CoA:carnitine CoA-transferase CaiB-like acyl-CoA transferase